MHWIIVLFAIIVGIGVLAIYLPGYILDREEHRLIPENLIWLRKAVLAYEEGAQKAGARNIFPDTLDELVKGGYLNAGDMTDLTNGLESIRYEKPNNKNNASFIIFEAHTKRNVYHCPLDGPIDIKRR